MLKCFNKCDLVKTISQKYGCLFVCLMVFNVTFNNISVISWRSVLLVEETGGTSKKISYQYSKINML